MAAKNEMEVVGGGVCDGIVNVGRGEREEGGDVWVRK